MRLIDADICLEKAWQNFYKQEDEHEKNIDGYDIMRDRFYEQSGFECCQQTIVNAPTVDAITMEQISKYVIEINKILEEEKDDARWCAGLRYSLRVLDKYCDKENRDANL